MIWEMFIVAVESRIDYKIKGKRNQLLVSLVIIKADNMHAISRLYMESAIPPIQSHGLGGEASSTDDLRDPHRIQRFTQPANSTKYLIILSVREKIIFSWSAYASKFHSQRNQACICPLVCEACGSL